MLSRISFLAGVFIDSVIVRKFGIRGLQNCSLQNTSDFICGTFLSMKFSTVHYFAGNLSAASFNCLIPVQFFKSNRISTTSPGKLN